MNEFQTKLWDDLVALVDTNEAFYYADHCLDHSCYRIFNYRLASYTDFCHPGALECRGIMYEIDSNGYSASPIRLASMPMHKFFNLNENPITMDLDLSQVIGVEVKADGSLISTFVHNNELWLKSKGSLVSDQAVAAMGWLEKVPDFKAELLSLTNNDHTVNMEWTAPDNRIVLGYDKPSLNVLNVRNNLTGEYVEYDQLTDYPNIRSFWIDRLDVNDPVAFVHSIPDMTGIEGYIAKFADGLWVKIKCNWYLALHHTKDSVNSPRRLFEAVLEEATDDMKSMFFDDKVAIRMIEEMESFVEHKYNHLVDTVERFYERNKHLERKEYAILGQQELERMYFGLAMQKYTGHTVDYKAFLKKQWKALGLKDEMSNEGE